MSTRPEIQALAQQSQDAMKAYYGLEKAPQTDEVLKLRGELLAKSIQLSEQYTDAQLQEFKKQMGEV